jgi:hypothetical protein
MIKDFKKFTKLNEDDEEAPFRLYGTGKTAEAALIEELKDLVDFINRANPIDQEDYNNIKEDIKLKTSKIKGNKSFLDFKDGFDWQDSVIKLSDWQDDLKLAVTTMNKKATKKGLN